MNVYSSSVHNLQNLETMQMFFTKLYINELYIYIVEYCSVIEKNDGEGNGTPLQDSCLENSMDGGAWWAAVYGVSQSRT